MSLFAAFRRIFKFADKDIELFEQNVAEKFRAVDKALEALQASASSGGPGNISNVKTASYNSGFGPPIPGDGTVTIAFSLSHTSLTGKRIIFCSYAGEVTWSAGLVSGDGLFDCFVASNVTPLLDSGNAYEYLVDAGIPMDGSRLSLGFVARCDAQVGTAETVLVAFQSNVPGGAAADEWNWGGTLIVADYLEAA